MYLRLLVPYMAVLLTTACATQSSTHTIYSMGLTTDQHPKIMTSEAVIVEQTKKFAGLETSFDKPVKLLHSELPQYPQPELAEGIQGNVVILYVVDESGKVADEKVERSTDEGFSRAGIEAISKWRFEPLTQHGVPVKGTFQQTFTFKI